MENQESQCFPLKFNSDSTGTLITLTRADCIKDRRLVFNNFPFFFSISVEYVIDDENGTLDKRIELFGIFQYYFLFICILILRIFRIKEEYKNKYAFGVSMVKELQYLTPTKFKCFVCKHKYEKEAIFIHILYCDGTGRPFSLNEAFPRNNLTNNPQERNHFLMNYVPVIGFYFDIYRSFFV